MEPITSEERAATIEYLKQAVAESPNPNEPLFEGGVPLVQALAEVENGTPLGEDFLRAWVEDERERLSEPPITQHISGNIEKGDDGLFSATFQCSGFTVEHLGKIIEAIEDAAEENTFFTMPVIRELEDPALVAKLDERLESIKNDPKPGIPWSQIKVEMTLKQVRKTDE